MPTFINLFDPSSVVRVSGAPNAANKRFGPPGCTRCPLDKVRGIKKLINIDRIEGKHLALFAQSPGRQENKSGIELVGDAGQFFWDACKKVGLRRADFDIQNVVRCWPVDTDEGVIIPRHTPTQEELHHCSVHNDAALQKMAADCYLILGQIAAKQLLGKDHKKTIQWREDWKGYVVCADHPSYIIRSGGESAGNKYTTFLERLRMVRAIKDNPGRFGYVYAQDYRALYTPKNVKRALDFYRQCDGRISVDIEDGTVDGKRVVLVIGFSWGRRKKDGSWHHYTRSVVVDHPENPATKEQRDAVVALLKEFLEDADVEKVMQNGAYDTSELRDMLGVRVKGFSYDTMYSGFIAAPHRHSFGLDDLANVYCPEFADWKEMVAGHTNYAEIKLAKLVKYNCADADVTKRIEYATSHLDGVRQPLVAVYTHCSETLKAMEKRGPILDRAYFKRVYDVVPKRYEALRMELATYAEKPNFNPRTSKQVAWLLFDKLRLKPPQQKNKKRAEKKRSTDKRALQIMAETARNPVPGKVIECRSFGTMKSTYLDSYEACANEHDGELRTRWNLTGTIAGRLSSGGKKKTGKRAGTLVNLQNIHGNKLLKNLLISDPRWYDLLDSQDTRTVADIDVFLAFDYSQIEIRFLAEMSQDKLLLQQFRSGKDIHCLVGAELTGWSPDKIKEDDAIRRFIKALHFGIVYGLGEGGLYDYLLAKGIKNITEARAQQLHREYFRKYKGVARYIGRMRRMAEELGYVETLFGFRRYLGAWDDTRGTYWGNQAVNCVDYKTQILTNRGWLNGDELTTDDLCYTDTGWQKPVAVNAYKNYEGPLMEFRKRGFNAVSTPNHRWKTLDASGEAETQTTYEMAVARKYEYCAIPRVSLADKPDHDIPDDVLRLIGWWLTDGFIPTTIGSGGRSVPNKSALRVSQSKPHRVKEIKQLMRRLGIVAWRGHVSRGCTYWHVGKAIGAPIRAMFPDRVLTFDFVSKLSRRQARLLWETMMAGNGDGRRITMGTRVKADPVMALACVAGYSTAIQEREPNGEGRYIGDQLVTQKQPCFAIAQHRRDTVVLKTRKSGLTVNARVIDGHGVWCPTFADDAAWVARREDSVFMTKNSPIQGSAHTLMLVAMALLAQKPKTLALLQRVIMEVHDALVFITRTADMQRAFILGKDLLENQTRAYVRKYFDIDLQVPLIAEAKAGYRYGVMVDVNADTKPSEFVKQWTAANAVVEAKVVKEYGLSSEYR